MEKTDTVFSPSIAALYEQHLLPLLFTPYALDLAGRLQTPTDAALLEIAAGTGAVTRILQTQQPQSVSITATDLNPGMLEVATECVKQQNVRFLVADAQSLPFPDKTFDAVLCQFGVMFFPDRIAAYKETLRVLKAGGTFLFNVWDHIEKNGLTFEVSRATKHGTAQDTPGFLERGPFGYADVNLIRSDLETAGFTHVSCDTVEKIGHTPSPREAVEGLCHGSPLRAEIYAHGEELAATRIRAAVEAISKRYGTGPIAAGMSAHVFTAKKSG